MRPGINRLVVAALAVVWLWTTGSGAAPPIKIHGNRVIIDEVYRSQLNLPKNAKVNQATADLIKKQLLDFLHRAGYTLATAEAKAIDGEIQVQLDEGRLEKVVFLGVGTLKTLRLKLDLNMPQHVFNRPNLVRQLRYLGKRHGVEDITFELVPVVPVEHDGPQLGDLGDISGHAIIAPGAAYELHIRLGHSEWGSGFGLDFEYDFPDGFVAGVDYKDSGLLFGEDRWKVKALAGMKIREELTGARDPYPALSRAMLEAYWYTPPLAGIGLRPYVWLRSDLRSRQRSDMDVEIYYSERLEGSLNLGYEITEGLSVSVGGGVQEKIIFGVEEIQAGTPVEEVSKLRPFILAQVELNLDRGGMRRDRRHQLKLQGRHFWVETQHTLGQVGLSYQKVFELGWHDLEIGGRAAWLWGQVLPDDEESVGGGYIRGVFGGLYVRRVAGASVEFRMSLARDLFKLSVFCDVAAYGEQDRQAGSESLEFANSFGPGFHALILDTFQLNLYLGFGFDSSGDFDYGLSASLEKVF